MIYTGVKIIRIEYDLSGNIFKANIAAKNYNEAVKYLASLLKKPFNVVSTGDLGNLDLVTPEIESLVLKISTKPTKKVPDSEKRSAGRSKARE